MIMVGIFSSVIGVFIILLLQRKTFS
jgi:hypothetical protein